MKKRFLILCACAFPFIPAWSQQVTTFRMGGVGDGVSSVQMGDRAEQKTIGEASLECTYAFRYVTDTLNREEKTKEDVMILQAGGGPSKFYSYLSFRADSLVRLASSPEEIMGNIERFRGGESWVLFKNHPAGKITFTDKIGRDQFLYEEEMPSMNWEILDETKEIEGYACQKAVTDFRGRRWTAWFSPEIPVSEGPWKLQGLPGLILEAYDQPGDYVFTLTGLRQVSGQPVTMAKRQYLKSKRIDYLKTLRKFREDPIGMMSQSGVNITIHKSDGGAPDPEAMAPKAMKYDFMETDYR